MRGILNGSTFETPDGQKYYRVKTDALKTKLYFRCKNYSKGCRVVLHTEYVDSDNKDVKVISVSGKHNHGFNLYSSKSGVRRGRKRNYAQLADYDNEDCDEYDGDGEDSDEYDEDGEDSEECEEEEDGGEEEEEEDGDGEEEDEENDTSEHDDEMGEEVAEETVEAEMTRISNGVGIMRYVQFLNWLGEEDLAEKVQYTAPIEFKMIYNIMHLYQECVKGSDYLIKDPKLTKEFLIKMRSFTQLGAKGCKHKERVQGLLDNGFLDVLRDIVAHFARDPTHIFNAIVKSKYKDDSTVGFEAIYGS